MIFFPSFSLELESENSAPGMINKGGYLSGGTSMVFPKDIAFPELNNPSVIITYSFHSFSERKLYISMKFSSA